MATTTHRERLVTWEDPGPALEAAKGLSGLDYLRGMLRGDFPTSPIARTMGFEGVEADEGRIVFRGEPGEHVLNPIGVVHGGFAATLVDSALGCAVQTTLPVGVAYTTVDLAVTYVRAITPVTGPVLCEATVVHRGRTIATAQARVTREADGKLLAHGTTTCLVIGEK
jgi:uncharacterized protein (TIGR00369 family)